MNELRGAWGAQNGDLEPGKFEPHHFRTLHTHIKQIMQNKSHRITSRSTQIHEPVLYILFLSEHTDEQMNEQT